MSETMRERIARSIARANRDESVNGLTGADYYEELADAVLAAIREPTDEMGDAGIEGYWDGFEDAPPVDKRGMSWIGMREAWRRMVDAAAQEVENA